MLEFIEKSALDNRTVTRAWQAKPTDDDAFNIICIKLQDLKNRAAGKTNYFGYEKPKFGTLEELIDVYVPSWVVTFPGAGPDGAPINRVKPIKGNFNGGFQTYREAVQICEDIWRQRDRYRPRNSAIIRAHN